MPISVFDRGRFFQALAGALLVMPWSGDGLKAAIAVATRDRSIRAPNLPKRLLARFPAAPSYAELVAFLAADASLRRALQRMQSPPPRLLAALPLPPKVRWSLRRPGMDAPPARLAGAAIPFIATEAALAEWLEIDIGHLRWYADVAGRNRRNPPGAMRTYRYRWIARAGSSPRLLEIPNAHVKRLQRRVLEGILNAVPAHPAAHGFCAGRSIVTNAAPHCGQAAVLKFDLTDFFPSVTSARIFRIFRTLGYPPRVSRLLMGLCTTLLPRDVWAARPGVGAPPQAGAVCPNGRPRHVVDFEIWQRLSGRHLPQGAPTSPALANLAAHRLDRRLAGLAQGAGATYTRYADDLTFSGRQALARTCRRMETLVAAIAADEGFSLNHRKTRLLRSGGRQQVAGVVVNIRPNFARAEFDRLKAILTNCARHGPASQNRDGKADFRAYLSGKAAHVAAIHAERGEKLRGMLGGIKWA